MIFWFAPQDVCSRSIRSEPRVPDAEGIAACPSGMKAKQKAKQKPKPSPSVKQSAGKDKAGKAKARAEPSSPTAKPNAKIRRKSQKSILNGYIRAKVSDSFC